MYTVLCGLTIHPPVANFLQCISTKNYKIWFAVDKLIATLRQLSELTLSGKKVQIVVNVFEKGKNAKTNSIMVLQFLK